MPTATPVSTSGKSSLHATRARKSLTLPRARGGPRKREVFHSPRKPKAAGGHLPNPQGVGKRTGKAPLMVRCAVWRASSQVFLAQYGPAEQRHSCTYSGV